MEEYINTTKNEPHSLIGSPDWFLLLDLNEAVTREEVLLYMNEWGFDILFDKEVEDTGFRVWCRKDDIVDIVDNHFDYLKEWGQRCHNKSHT